MDDQFPDLVDISLSGIARLASEGELLTHKRRVEYRNLPTRRWINRCQSRRGIPFDWTINPYRGCEYGCKYCYARYTHEFMEREAEAFETELFAKKWDEAAFRLELRSVRPGQSIAIGTATDPYQPAERRYELTRRVLGVLATSMHRRIYLTTKSDLVPRDIDLWQRISERNAASITVSITTTNTPLARLLEPYAPRPDLRFEAVRKLAAAGLRVCVLAAPVLPLITDSPANLEAVAQAAKEAGACGFGACVLFLKPATKRVFLPFLEQQFPQHMARYVSRYARKAYLDGEYPQRISRLIEEIRHRTGLIPRHDLSFVPGLDQEQLRLF